ncbi:MAG: M48 family metallopeptidase [Verrucomicrobiota bacterium]|nr:M48 family metallopeptidase [Verrucomicrobiales bacterium]MEC9036848.1 M48 family metallopeptidase [Verrucomicrobiota bacterium]MEE2966643.1 M48 family metallopeptidase [Verrucomicrobiota bacterium]|tara:strand:+ start:28 stop:1272 length:1245 start_codon:yes stop_codon:yes gene_type:complete
MNIEPNLFFWIILIAVVGIFILDLFSEWLNIKGLKLDLPQDFKDVFDQEKYSKSLEYTRVTTKFGAIQSSFDLIIFLLFWIVGGFGWLSNIIIGLGHGPVLSGLLFFSILFISAGLLNLPFEIHDTFKIEAKFGFNKTTRSTFISDKIKGLVLGALIGLPVLGLIIWLFESFENAWLWGWIFLSGFSLLMAYLAPAVILPLFNKFEPLEEGELKSAINDMAENCKFPLTELSVMDGSKRSSKSNAFFTGFGKNKKIALYDTLIANHSTSELVAVLAHEIGHFKKKHIMQTLFLGIAQTGVLFFVLGFFIRSEPLSSAFGVKEPQVYCSLLFFTILFKPISKILSVLMNILSRKNEFEADAYAADVTGNADSLITALKKLSADNLSNLTPHPFYVFMNYSHPPVSERIVELRKIS